MQARSSNRYLAASDTAAFAQGSNGGIIVTGNNAGLFVAAGGLISYGTNFLDQSRRAAGYVCASASSAGHGMSAPMRGMRSGCCARAANGHAAAEPQTSFMNSRRLIDAPEAQDRPSYRLKPAYWKGANVRFGQKQTLKRLHPMSAIPSKADIRWSVRMWMPQDLLLRPCAIVPMESAKCQGYDRRGASGAV
jgi:hypothetical protein